MFNTFWCYIMFSYQNIKGFVKMILLLFHSLDGVIIGFWLMNWWSLLSRHLVEWCAFSTLATLTVALETLVKKTVWVIFYGEYGDEYG